MSPVGPVIGTQELQYLQSLDSVRALLSAAPYMAANRESSWA